MAQSDKPTSPTPADALEAPPAPQSQPEPPADPEAPPREQAADHAAPAVTAPHRSGSGGAFLAGLLGGALAIAAGVGALWLSNPDLLRGKAPEPDFAPVTARLDAQDAALARLSAALEAAPGDVTARLDTLDAETTATAAAVEALRTQLEALAARPAAAGGEVSPQALDDLRGELDRQRAALEGLLADTSAAQAAAEAAARAGTGRAALTRVQAALEAGGPFDEVLDDFAQTGAAPIPPALGAVAATGVATLADLRAGFPDAARAALAAAVRTGLPENAGAMDRIGAFLRTQTGARSTAPRDGDDPDAILSRAEARLAEGDLPAALTELDALPEAGAAEMAPWRAAAEARLAALAAAEALSAALTAN